MELVAWHVALGESVKEDQPVADVMTDKASVEIPCHVHGKVIALGAAVGQMISVGAELIRLEVEGEGNLKDDAAPAQGICGSSYTNCSCSRRKIKAIRYKSI